MRCRPAAGLQGQQRPCGTGANSRRPREVRPQAVGHIAVLVAAQISSMKTRCGYRRTAAFARTTDRQRHELEPPLYDISGPSYPVPSARF